MNIKSTKGKLLMSAVSLLVCMSMLVTSTFAWFTDTASSANNIIASGNLDVELYHSSASVTGWENVDAKDTLFRDAQGEPMLWEPGVVTYENFKIVNEGDLALKYRLAVTTADENYVVDAANPSAKHGLSQVLKVGVVDGGIYPADGVAAVTRADVVNKVTTWQPLATNALYGGDDTLLLPATNNTIADNTADEGTVTAAAQPNEKIVGLVVYWQPSDNDNNFNLNNGKQLSADVEGATALTISLGVRLDATQAQYESDSFGSDYDAAATFPELPVQQGPFTATLDITGLVDENGLLIEDVIVGEEGAGMMYALVPAGTLTTGSALTLTIDTTDRSDNIEMTRGQVSRSLDVHMDGIHAENTVPATIALGHVMPVGYKDANVALYHVENEKANEMDAVGSIDNLAQHNQFMYNAANGELFVSMASFSEVTMVIAAGDPWDGTRTYEWYTKAPSDAKEFTISNEAEFAGFAAIVGGMADGIEQDDFNGKTVKLGANLDLGGKNNKVWYPIGYHNSNGNYNKVSGGSVTSDVSSFEGTFDGQGHTISNIYQNTWDMFGDYNSGYTGTPNHYKDGMGIFGFVYNGTVKDLTVNNFQSDGEFCTTGCVAAYASGSSTFDNINVLNSNPRAYNVPNGGVVGYAYDEDGATNVINFNNIKVDSSNKISALWGSWDVGCGGILGRVNGATTINMTNCEVGAVIDVFNDVCGNYQYYQYRYSGMLIGTVGGDGDPKSGNEKVNFSNVNVYIGNWADYYFCEFEKNSQGSYTDDYQFSRVEKNDIIFNDSTNLPKGCTHEHQGTEDKLAVYLPFDQLYTGYGWGATPVKSADGVTVTKQFYSVTYMDALGENVLDVKYVTTGERSEERIWADAYTVRTGSISTPASGQQFKYWVNAGSAQVTSIPAGNRNDVVLYESWDNPYTARFVDQFGNVIYSETFTKTNPTVSAPAVPTVDDCIGVWENYNLKNATGDVTIKPIYTYEGKLKLTPVDDPEDGVIDYYKVEAVSELDETTYIPGYFNGLPVKLVEKLYKNDNNWDFGADVKTIIIGEGVEELAHNSLGYTKNLTTVELPSTIKKINKNAFSRNTGDDRKTITIEYAGTMAEWQKVLDNSADDWHNGLRSGTKVICTDGYFELKTTEGPLTGVIYTYKWTAYPNS